MLKAKDNRIIMKSGFVQLQGIKSDQQLNLAQPPLQKVYSENEVIIDLPSPEQAEIKNPNLSNCIKMRKSRRNFLAKSISPEELSYLLWATQGVRSVINRMDKAYATLRTVPSAGARHPFETYLVVYNVNSIDPGIYRYLALEHKLLFVTNKKNLNQLMLAGTFGQEFSTRCSVVFIWSCIAYRGEWRYHRESHKVMLLDGGHVCQNLYLACETLGLGTCAIAAYDQEMIDNIIQVDGENEFTIYLAPVGQYK